MRIRKLSCLSLVAATAVFLGGCYYTFDVSPARSTVPTRSDSNPDREIRTYEERVPTYLGGTVGPASADPTSHCAHPLRVENRVGVNDMAASAVTGFLYKPYTVYVTCEVPRTDEHMPSL